MPELDLILTIRHLASVLVSRLQDEDGVTTTELAVVIAALVILAATAAAVIGTKVMDKVNSISL
jgi:Tfp pilus assembly protein FimT